MTNPTRAFADPRAAVPQALLLMAAGLAASAWLRPDDPFWRDAAFPWLWLLPVLPALRHGVLGAVTALGLTFAVWMLWAGLGAHAPELPRQAALAGGVLALLCGYYADRWRSRLAQAFDRSTALGSRVAAQGRELALLEQSHLRLEQEFIAHPHSLREMMVLLRSLILSDGTAPLPAAAWLLHYLGQTCRFEAAALHAVRQEQLSAQPVAALGDGAPLAPADPLLRTALESRALSRVRGDSPPGVYLLAAPILTSEGRLLGMLVVRRMAFVSLTADTLRFIALTLGYYADGVAAAESARPVQAAEPRCPTAFAAELARLARIHADGGMPSTLVAFSPAQEDEVASELLDRIRSLRRPTDLDWNLRGETGRALVVLLPLSNAAGARGYVERLETTLTPGRSLGAAGLATRMLVLDTRPAGEQLREFLAPIDV
jgi:hypothetical protein